MKKIVISVLLILIYPLLVMANPPELRELIPPDRLAKVNSIESMRAVGTIEMAGLKGDMELIFAAPDKIYMTQDLGIFKYSQFFDGQRAWMTDQNNQTMELTGMELRNFINAAYISGMSHLRDDRMPGSITYAKDTVIDDYVYMIYSILPAGGNPLAVFYNKSTGRIEISREYFDEVEIVTYMSDFYEVDGLEMPFSSKTESAVPQFNSDLHFSSIEFNVDVDKNIFLPPSESADDYLFPAEKDSVIVPFEFYNGHIFIQASVNGGKQACFILDSGAGTNVLDKKYAEENKLNIKGEIPAKGISGYQSAALSHVDSLVIGEIKLFRQVVGVLDLAGLGLRLPGELGGLVGYDLLSRMPVKVRYSTKELIFYNPAKFIKPDAEYAVDFETIMKVPMVIGKYADVEGRFLIDFGNPFSLVLHRPFVEKNNLSTTFSDIKNIDGGIGGVGGKSKVEAATGTVFKIGPAKIDKPPIMLATSKLGIAESSEVDGNIGNLMLQKFTILLDYRENKLYILPPEQ